LNGKATNNKASKGKEEIIQFPAKKLTPQEEAQVPRLSDRINSVTQKQPIISTYECCAKRSWRKSTIISTESSRAKGTRRCQQTVQST
jgi:hypothetical protein